MEDKIEVKIDEHGTKSYYKNGKRHRLNGPAVEFFDGSRHWYYEGRLHRLNGPAKEHSDGWKNWYYEGRLITSSSQEDFERLIRPHLSGSLLM